MVPLFKDMRMKIAKSQVFIGDHWEKKDGRVAYEARFQNERGHRSIKL